MISFDLTPRPEDPSWRRDWQPLDPATRSPVELRELAGAAFTFEYFQVDVVLVIGKVEFSLRKIGIPVLDFVLMLDSGVKETKSTGESRVETSISQDLLHFRSKGTLIAVSSSFSVGVAMASIGELEQLVGELFEQALRLLRGAHPELVDNPYLISLSSRVGN